MKSILIHTYRLIFILSLFFIAGCTEEYTKHYYSERKNPGFISPSLTGESVPDNPEVLILPDKNVRDKLVEHIDHAKERVWIEVYTWTDKTLLDAVVRAHKRGIDVRIVLEGNVFGTPTINKKIFDILEGYAISVVYSDTFRYIFTHAKFLIIDDEYFISTGNLTQSFFTKNRDFIVHGSGASTTLFLSQLFQRDFEHLGIQDLLPIPAQLVISPVDSREKTISFLKEARKEIIIYTQTLQDEEILDILRHAKKENIQVAICTAKNESNTLMKTKWDFHWIEVTKPYLHAKVIVIDAKDIFIGSQNLTQNSLDKNREVGIIIRSNSGVLMNMMRIYRQDCE